MARQLQPGARVGFFDHNGDRTMGVRQDGSHCWATYYPPTSCGGGRHHELALCPECCAPMRGSRCRQCGSSGDPGR